MHKLARVRTLSHQFPYFSATLEKICVSRLINAVDEPNDKLTITHEFYEIHVSCPLETSAQLHCTESRLTLSDIVGIVLLADVSKGENWHLALVQPNYPNSV